MALHVVLLHAFPLDCRMWSEVKHVLVDAGYHVSAPDLPGPEAEPSLGAWAERVLRSADGPLVPVGASMGGYLAFELWRRGPERIAGLALVATRAGAETPETRRGRDETIALLEDDGVTALWERLGPNLFAPGASPEVVAGAREIALEQGATRLVAAVAAMRDRRDSRELLGEIDVPVLVAVGEADGVIAPEEAEALVAALPDARLVRIDGAGHLVPLERPDHLARELLAFLAELD